MAQKYLNDTPHRSIGTMPFNLLFGANIKMKGDASIRELIERELIDMFQEESRNQAKESIRRVQQENRGEDLTGGNR